MTEDRSMPCLSCCVSDNQQSKRKSKLKLQDENLAKKSVRFAVVDGRNG